MSHSRSWIPVAIVAALGCSGCVSPLIEAKTAATSVSPTISSLVDNSSLPTQHVARTNSTSRAIEPTPTNPNPNRFRAATTPATLEQKTEVDLADLDRALNSTDSGLPPQYQAYLREQLSAIAGRVPTVLSQDRVPRDYRSQVALAVAQSESLPQPLDTVTPSQPLASNERISPRPTDRRSTEPATHPTLDIAPGAPPIRDTPALKLANKTDMSSVSAKEPASLTTTTADAEEVRRGEWREHLTRTLDTLERELARFSPSDRVGEQMATSARLLHLIANHRDQAVAAMDNLSEDEREYWKHQMHALTVALDADDKHAGSRRAALALRELREAEDHLANLSTLDVRNLAFCERVEGFGVYTPVKTNSFKPGQQVWLYVEIDNFAVQQVGDKYATKLQAEYNLVDASGGRISNKKLDLVDEECRNRRHDYCISYTLDVPKDLRPGLYALQLTVEDVIGQKSSQASIDFRIR